MWDDIIYGSGKKLTSAKGVPGLDIKEDVSQNSEAYWITGCYLGVGMTVFKSSPEGAAIGAYISDKDADGLSEYLDSLVLSGLGRDGLQKKIDAYGESRFIEGVESIQEHMRECLGLPATI